jgi:ABC-type phosphate transport system substrate-binding protein
MRRFLRVALTTITLTLGFNISAVRADVVAVVSSKSPITLLTRNQIIDIFLGRKTRFPDGSVATPIDQSEGSAARLEFYSRYAAMSEPQVKAVWAKIVFTGRGQSPKTVATDVEAKKALSATPNAITYIDQSLVDDSVRVVLAP